jgi:hypothetical protein
MPQKAIMLLTAIFNAVIRIGYYHTQMEDSLNNDDT